MRNLAFLLGILLLAFSTSWGAWRSELYPLDWNPEGKEFYSDAFIQDYSRAGYRSGDTPLPTITGPVRDVTTAPFNADNTGRTDATLAIQTAIDATAAAGGGVVYLPAGTYRISPQGSDNFALLINTSNIVLRGAGTDQTFLCNAGQEMRSKSIIRITGPASAFLTEAGIASSPLTADLPSPTTQIPVQDGSLFAVGDWVTVRTDITDAWISEHNISGWTGYGSNLGGFAYRRQIVSIDGNTVQIDIPTRYALKIRDNARLIKNTHSGITEVGLEDFSIGNIQRGGTAWGEESYNTSTHTAYQTHASDAVQFSRARDCWMRNVSSYQSVENTTTAHILSNGVILNDSHRITLEGCHFQRPQYGGGGGNGYMFRLSNTSDCLLKNCRATYSRHGFVFSNMRASGNVFHRCTDTTTGRAIGSSSSGYSTSGSGSDHHMHFSHSNLIDACTVNSSFFSAAYRPYGSTPQHLVTAAHSVFWNMEGLGSGNAIVETEQMRYGYAIGTRGTRTGVSRPTGGGSRMAPADWVEGTGQGDTLEPFSLYEDQLRRRMKAVALPSTLSIYFPNNSIVVAPDFLVEDPDDSDLWTKVDGPGSFGAQSLTAGNTRLTFGTPGVYMIRLDAVRQGRASSATTTVTVHTSTPRTEIVVLPTLEDSYIYDGATTTNYGSSTTLALKSQGGSGYRRQVVQKFDLSTLQGRTIQQVIWKATASTLPAAASSWNIATVRLPTTWQEDAITWSNAPAALESVASWVLNDTGFGSFDATTAVQSVLDASETQIAFKHYDTIATQSQLLYFPSRESGSAGVAVLEATLIAPTPGFAEWVQTYLPENQRGTLDDPDGDGLSNIVEYAMGTDPSNANDAGSLGLTARPNGHVTLSYPLSRLIGPGISVIVEQSTTLKEGDWAPLPASLQQLQLTDSLDMILLDFEDAPDTPRRFFRLRVTVEDPAGS